MSSANRSEEGAGKKQFSPARFGLYAVLAVLGAGAGALTAELIARDAAPDEADFPPSAIESGFGIGRFQRLAQPQPVPGLAFTDAGGSQRLLSEWRGQVVLLNLWATWCAPCKAEMPSLDRLQARLGGSRFTVLAISTDRSGPERPAAFFANASISHLGLYNDKTAAAASLLKAPGLPLSIILDEQGREVARLIGPADWDGPEVTAQIEGILKEARPG